jgi:hypothetical protein
MANINLLVDSHDSIVSSICSCNVTYAAVKVKSTFPELPSAPPMHVDVKGESPHVARAALIQPSHLPLVMSIV